MVDLWSDEELHSSCEGFQYPGSLHLDQPIGIADDFHLQKYTT